MVTVYRSEKPKQNFLQKGLAVTAEELQHKDSIWWETRIVEPKLDGIRAIYYEGNLYSYNNKSLYNVVPIIDEIKKYNRNNKFVYDGELFSGNWEETFSVVSASKTKKPLGDIQFHIFDCLPQDQFESGVSRSPLRTRRNILLNNIPNIGVCIRIMPGIKCRNFEHATRYFESLIIQPGYEGVMIKDLLKNYEFRRVRYWLKWKQTQTEDIQVVGFNSGMGKYVGTLGSLQCVDEQKRPVCVSGMDDTMRKEIWNHQQKYINKIIEVEYRKKTTKGTLFSAQFKRWREDK